MATTVKTFTWNADLESFTPSATGSGVYDAVRDASNGDTAAGSLQVYARGRKDEVTGTFTLSSVTWEDLGVPANQEISDVQVTGVSTYYGLTDNNVPDIFGAANVYVYGAGTSTHVGTGVLYNRAQSGSADGSWQQSSGASQAVTSSYQPGDTSLDIMVFMHALAGNNSSAVIGVHMDDLEITITHADAALDFSGTATVSHTSATSSSGDHDGTATISASNTSAVVVTGNNPAAPSSEYPVLESKTETDFDGSGPTITHPAGLEVDDLMLAIFGAASPPISNPTATDWVAGTNSPHQDSGPDAGVAWLTKIADAADVSAGSTAFTTGETGPAAMYRISGVDTAVGIQVESVSSEDIVTVDWDASAVVSTTDKNLIIAFAVADGNSGHDDPQWSSDDAWTEVSDYRGTGSFVQLVVNTYEQESAGSITHSWTRANAEFGPMVMLAIKPEAGTGEPTGTLTVSHTSATTASGTAGRTGTASVGATTVIMSDDFGRTSSDEWGQASGGGYYDLSGTNTQFDVNSGVGKMVNASGSNVIAGLYPGQREIIGGGGTEYTTSDGGVEIQDIDMSFMFRFDTLPTTLGDDVQFDFRIRNQRDDDENSGTSPNPTDDYYVVRVAADAVDNAWRYQLKKAVTGSNTNIHGSSTDTGTTPAANEWWRVRLQAEGLSPTTIRMKLWKNADSEPGSWLFETTDSESVLQDDGGVAIGLFATDTGGAYEFDDLSIVDMSITGHVSSTSASGTKSESEDKSGSLTVSHTSSATVSGTKAQSADITVSHTSAATVTASTGRSGDATEVSHVSSTTATGDALEVRTGTTSASNTSAVAVTASTGRQDVGSVSHTSSTTATGEKGHSATVSVSAVSAATVAASTGRLGSVTESNTSGVAATGTASEGRTGTITVSHVSGVTVTGSTGRQGTITESNTSATTATGDKLEVRSGTLTVSHTSAVAIADTTGRLGSITESNTSATSASGTAAEGRTGTVTVSHTSAVVVTGTTGREGVITPSATSSVTVVGIKNGQDGVTVPHSASVIATGASGRSGTTSASHTSAISTESSTGRAGTASVSHSSATTAVGSTAGEGTITVVHTSATSAAGDHAGAASISDAFTSGVAVTGQKATTDVATVSHTHSVTAAGTASEERSGTVTASATSAVVVVGIRSQSSDITASAVSSATVSGARAQSATISVSHTSAATVVGTAAEGRLGSLSESAVSSVSVTGAKAHSATVSDSFVSDVTVTGVRAQEATISVSASSAVTASGTAAESRTGTASVSHASAVTSSGTHAGTGTVTESYVSDIAIASTTGRIGVIAIGVASDVTVVGVTETAGTITVSATSSTTTSGYKTHIVPISVVSTSSLVVSGIKGSSSTIAIPVLVSADTLGTHAGAGSITQTFIHSISVTGGNSSTDAAGGYALISGASPYAGVVASSPYATIGSSLYPYYVEEA